MANAKIGSYSSYGYSFVESIDTTNKQLTPGDSGKIWMCDQNGTADVDVNLPQLSTKIAGWYGKFVLRTAAANDFHIVVYGEDAAGGTDGDADTIVYLEEADANTLNSAADSIQFTGGGSTAGDYCDVFTDGSKWYAHIHSSADAGVAPVG